MTTANLGLTVPTVGADADNWGNDLNTDLALIDTFATRQTRQKLTSGSSATYTTPTGCRQLRIRMIGAGAGAFSVNGGTAGGDGGATSFNSVVANGGKGARFTYSGNGSGTASLRVQGGPGYFGTSSIVSVADGIGGNGASTVFGSGGFPGISTTLSSGSGPAGSGAGGGGGGTDQGSARFGGPGGGAGEYVDLIIDSPAATYTYTVGTPGSGASAVSGAGAGGGGGSGLIVIDELY